MRLEHFQYIVEIARCKSMSKASKKLFITQPSLSTAIQNLEEELGFQIFKRSASGVALTDKGESLLSIAEEVVHQLEQIKELSDPATDTFTHLNLAAVPVFCNALMIELIQTLKQKNPLVNLNIIELRPAKILPALISGTADLAIGTYSPSTKEQIFQEAAKNNLIIKPIFDDKMYCFVHRNHPMAHKKSVSMEDMADSTPAFFNDHVFMESYECQQNEKPQRLDHEYKKNYYSFTDRASIKKAISKGLAYSTLPRLMAYDDIYVNAGMIIPVPLADSDTSLTTYVAYSSRSALPKAARQAIEIVQQLYQSIAEQFAKSDVAQEQAETQKKRNQFLSY